MIKGIGEKWGYKPRFRLRHTKSRHKSQSNNQKIQLLAKKVMEWAYCDKRMTKSMDSLKVHVNPLYKG